MPVSGNEEAKVLARLSSDISSGIPLKKRRFLLDPPPSPPCNEPPAALLGISDGKVNEESGSDLKLKEEFRSDSKEKEGSCSQKDKQEYKADTRNTEAAGSNLQNKVESLLGSSVTEESRSDQGSVNSNVTEKYPGNSDVGNTNLREVKKEIVPAPGVHLSNSVMKMSGPKLLEVSSESGAGFLSLTGKTVASEAPKITGAAVLVSVKKEMESKQMDDGNPKLSVISGNDQNKLGTKEFLVSGFGYPNLQSNVDRSVPAPALSLSLTKEVENRIGDASLTSHGEIRPADRSNWDLNTTMDDWEGTAPDAGFRFDVLGSTEKTDPNSGRVFSGFSPVVRSLSEKGKQVIPTSMPRSSFPNSCRQLIPHSEDSLRLTLSPSFQDKDYGRVLSGLTKNVAGGDVAYLHRVVEESLKNKISSDIRVVKSEPSEENSSPNPAGTLSVSTKLLDASSLKKEPVDKENIQALKLTASSTHNLTGPKCIKAEPTGEACVAISGAPDSTRQQLIVKFGHSQESGSSSVLAMPVTPPNPSPSRPPASSELSMSADISSQSDLSVHTKECHLGVDIIAQSATDMNPNLPNSGSRDEVLTGSEVGNRAIEDKNVDDSKTESVKERLQNLHASGEGSVSDEEKLNISAELMEESYDSDYESDGNQVSASRIEKPNRCVRDDEEYEDGEVRESGMASKITANEIRVKSDKLECKTNDPQSGTRDDVDQFQPDIKDNDLKIHDDSNSGEFAENVGFVPTENYDPLSDKDGPSLNLSLEEKAETNETVVHEKEPCISDQINLADNSGNKSSTEGAVKDKSFEGTSSGCRIAMTTCEAKGEIFKAAVDTAEKPSSSLHVEASSNDTNAAEDSNHAGNRGRIISLPRASARSPCKTKQVPDKLPSSRNGRERDEMDTDGFHRFGRERIQDQSFRNSRGNYSRGRGRFSGRFNTSRSEWGSGRDFAEGSYRDDYRFTRSKHAADISDAKLDCDEYLVAPDGGALNTGRGRKSLNNDLPSYRHASSRRFSPGGREGPAGRGAEVLRRMPRNISPGTRNSENGIGLVGLRHDEKFVRVLSDGVIDHPYTRQHRMYEGGDSQFIQGNRNFSTFRRGGFPRVRSKSPVGRQTRSPGSWASPRRRSPDGFNRLPHITQRRSPAMYGVERMRSPDRPCFPEQMAARRRNSPSYMARPFNDSRDVDSGRDHGRRPINSSRRSPPERIFNRSNRRLDDFDPPTRSNDDANFFGRPVSSARFHEFNSDACSDERRKCGERRGLTRPFGPAQVGDSGNVHIRFQSDDSPRPLRFHPDMDTEFAGRGINQRDFDGRMKNRQLVAPRRIREIDDQEGSYRHTTGQVWQDDAFNEESGFKRRRY
ncbi:OLC1v1001096C5 [Oldenlandia corymbosa var. corymbosa]|uniref:OLC1v1001096C5 n=1 Tax=Oldenlandia corymbosa var. corymbosa TaxID=529605 RepID=A0AAV1D4W2_OLDCO|nr:OLC1v1001096C5 [Oldenlandia corymbosa var. corymbosa]